MMPRILHIDDEPSRVKAYVDFLREKGLEIDCAGSSKEGIEKIKKKAYDLILLDIMFTYENESAFDKPLHEMGIWIIKEIMAQKFPQNPSSTPIVVLTALVEPNELQEIRDLGVEEVLVKPVNLYDFHKKLLSIIELNNK
jgi:CheY-like chemotaxis protein